MLRLFKKKAWNVLGLSSAQWNAIKGAFLLIYGLLLGKFYSLLVSQTATSSEKFSIFVLMIITVILVLIFALNINILGTIEKLDNRHRFRIEFVPAVESDSHDVVHEKAKAFLEKADLRHGCHIIAVNSYLEAASSDTTSNQIQIFADDYYSKIEELVQGGALYSRIVQLPNNVTFSEWITKTKVHYKKHFVKILKMQSSARQAVLLMSARARFPLSFLLIKNQNGTNYLIWQIDEQTTGDANNLPQFQLHGIFLIEDPDKMILGHFDWCFNQLLHTNTRIEPVVLDDKEITSNA